MHGTIDRRAGFCEDARHAKRFVLVLDERDRADAVRDNDFVADLIAERLRDVRSDHRVEQILERPARGECPCFGRDGTYSG